MNSTGYGFLLLVAAALMNASFTLPMKFTRHWAWENTWLVWTFFALLLLPAAVALYAVPDLAAVYRMSGARLLCHVVAFGTGWGIAQGLFGMAAEAVEIAQTFSLVLSPSVAKSALVLMLKLHPAEFHTVPGNVLFLDIAQLLPGAVICVVAGRLRENAMPAGVRKRRGSTTVGLRRAIVCGLVENKRLRANIGVSLEEASRLHFLLGLMEEALRFLLQRACAQTNDCAGLAIGFPGIVDARKGRMLFALKKYKDAPGLDLSCRSREAFGIPLRIENDEQLALLEGKYLGSARECDGIVTMTLGTGVGRAAMIHGHALRGAHSQAGCHGGHIPGDFRGRLFSRGNIGCAERKAGDWLVLRLAGEWLDFDASALASKEKLDFEGFFNAATQGDHVAIKCRQHCLDVWAASIVALVRVYDHGIVVVGGRDKDRGCDSNVDTNASGSTCMERPGKTSDVSDNVRKHGRFAHVCPTSAGGYE